MEYWTFETYLRLYQHLISTWWCSTKVNTRSRNTDYGHDAMSEGVLIEPESSLIHSASWADAGLPHSSVLKFLKLMNTAQPFEKHWLCFYSGVSPHGWMW